MSSPAIVTSKKADRSGRGHRIGRTLRDMAVVPTIVIVAFAVLAAISIVADQTNAVPLLNTIRSAMAHVIGPKAASAALQAVATGLVTVTSITFSVLLLAVQQTASSLSPVVFNQFLQRKSNQVYLGFFVGLALYSYVTMAAVQQDTPPIVGATLAIVLTLVALGILLVLVYSTIVQMRPTSVMRAIHDRTLLARHREGALLGRTRRQSESRHEVLAQYVSLDSGYVTAIDLNVLSKNVSKSDDVEVILHVTVGSHIGHGDVVASVKDGDRNHAKRLAAQAAKAVEVGKEPELSADPTTGISEIGNIAWTSGSTARQNPAIAREALDALTDICSRWLDDREHESHIDPQDVLPIVYEDNDLDRVLEEIYNLLVSANESHQHHLSAWVIDAYCTLMPRARGGVRQRMERDLETGKPLLDAMPPSPMLAAARDRLDEVRRRLMTQAPDEETCDDNHARDGEDSQ